MNNKISPKVQTLVGLSIFIFVMGVQIFLSKILFGHTPGEVIQTGLLGMLTIPAAVYFFSNVSTPINRSGMSIYILILCFFLTSIDGRLRISLILVMLIITDTSIYLSKKKRPINGQSYKGEV